MTQPFEACTECVANSFCGRIGGNFPPLPTEKECNAKFRLDKALALSGIPKKYINANLYNYTVDANNKAIYDKLQPVIDNIFDEVAGGFSAILFGSGSGTGKTYNAVTLLNHYIYKGCLKNSFDFETPLAKYIEYAPFIDDLRYVDDEELMAARFSELLKTPLLLLDDVGAGHFTDFAREQTYIIVNHRYNNNLSTLVTSNLDLNALKDTIGTRTMSRLLSNSMLVEFTGADRRRSIR
jgi:DNA replication protein DnaC